MTTAILVVLRLRKPIATPGGINAGNSFRSGGSDRRWQSQRLRKLGYRQGQGESPAASCRGAGTGARIQVATDLCAIEEGPFGPSPDLDGVVQIGLHARFHRVRERKAGNDALSGRSAVSRLTAAMALEQASLKPHSWFSAIESGGAMVKSKSPSSCPCVSICRGVPFKSLLSSRRRLFAPAFSLGTCMAAPMITAPTTAMAAAGTRNPRWRRVQRTSRSLGMKCSGWAHRTIGIRKFVG